MISGKVLTAAFLLNRTWPIQQVTSGKAASIIEKSLMALSPEESAALRAFESESSFLI